MKRPAEPPVRLVKFAGLASAREPSFLLPTFVSHNDVSLNYVESGWIRSLMATGFRYELKPGRLAVFWGAVPHKVEALQPGGIGHSVSIPLGTFLGWPMPSGFTQQLIRGRVFFEPDEQEGPSDLTLLNRWHREIASRDPEAIAIVLLDLESRLRRLARSCPVAAGEQRITPRGRSSKAERMLLLVASHFREPLNLADIAEAVEIHPVYASRLFTLRFGMRLNEYISECRIAHAKALLATTERNVLDVAMDSGFGSISQFHEIFKRLCGCTPRAYRASLRAE